MTLYHEREAEARHLWRFAVPIGIILAFQNGIDVWRQLDGRFDSRFILVAFVPVIAGLLVFFRKRPIPFTWQWLGIAGLVSIALYLPDSRYPAKLAHVPEYIMVALSLRWAGQHYFRAPEALTVFCAAMTVLLGLHDEMMQGLHPDRRFGVVDCLVNGLSGVAGAWMGGIVMTKDHAATAQKMAYTVTLYVAVIVLAAGLLAFLWACWRYKGLPVPLWTAAPLAAACLNVYFSRPFDALPVDMQKVATISTNGLILLPLYIIVAHVSAFAFD